MNTDFSPNLQKVFARCQNEAVRHNNSVVEPSHILLALLSDREDTPWKLVENASQSTSAGNLRQDLDNCLFEDALSRNAGVVDPAAVTISDVANRIIRLSILEARMLKSKMVESQHLLLAIFHNSETRNESYMKLFNKYGVNYESLLKQLSNVSEQPRMGDRLCR